MCMPACGSLKFMLGVFLEYTTLLRQHLLLILELATNSQSGSSGFPVSDTQVLRLLAGVRSQAFPTFFKKKIVSLADLAFCIDQAALHS